MDRISMYCLNLLAIAPQVLETLQPIASLSSALIFISKWLELDECKRQK